MVHVIFKNDFLNLGIQIQSMKKYLLFILLFSVLKYHSKAECGERYLYKVFDSVDIIRDIPFGQSVHSTGDVYDLKMDIYMPHGDVETNRPLFVYMHGGTFVSGDKGEFEGYGPPEDMAKRGYVGVSINYRTEPSLLSLTSAELMIKAVMRVVHDCRASIRYFYKDVKENGNTYGIDTNWVFVGGASAGSIAALHLAYLDDTSELELKYRKFLRGFDGGDLEGISGNPGYSSTVRGVCDVSGCLANTSYMFNNADIAVYSLHNIIDLTIPYDKGYPMFIPILPIVEGSKPIQERARMIGALHYFETIYDEGHVPYKDGESPVQPIFDNMMRETYKLFYQRMGCNPNAVISGVNINKNSGWKIFPNLLSPGNPVRLENQKYNPVNTAILSLTDITGREIISQKVTTSYLSVPTDKLPTGIYFVQIRNSDGELQLSDKIVLQ